MFYRKSKRIIAIFLTLLTVGIMCVSADTLPLADHEHSYEQLFDINGHFDRCSICGEATSAEAHIFDNSCDGECNGCNYTRVPDKHRIKSYTIENDENYPFLFKDGIYSSTNKDDSSTSTMTLTVIEGGTFNLQYSASTESTCDFLRIKHNDTNKYATSGEHPWSTATFKVVPGDKIYLSYSKNYMNSEGSDTAYFRLPELPLASEREASCEEGVVCEICGTPVKSPLGHIYDNNCDTDCNRCNTERTITHRYFPATCTEPRICSVCGIESGDPLGHNYVWLNDRDESCGVDGIKHEECTLCRNIRSSETVIPATNKHIYDNDCDTSCNICGLTRTAEHIFGDYIYNNDATYTSDGTQTRTCSVCGWAETVTAEGTRLTADSSKLFTDINKDAWYKPYIDYAINHGIMIGAGNARMLPAKPMTRAEFIQVLANLSGIDTSDKSVDTDFNDVKAGQWFAPAVRWASENGIVAGLGNGAFDPNGEITREQICLILTRYAESYLGIIPENDNTEGLFADDENISSWARAAVYKCRGAGLIVGVSETEFAPMRKAERASVATVMTRFHQNYVK